MMHTVITECQIHIFAVLLCLVFTGGPDVSFRCAVSLQEGPPHRTQLDSAICSSTRHWHREEIYHSGGSNPLQTEPAGVDWPQISGRAAVGLISVTFSHIFSLLQITDPESIKRCIDECEARIEIGVHLALNSYCNLMSFFINHFQMFGVIK